MLKNYQETKSKSLLSKIDTKVSDMMIDSISDLNKALKLKVRWDKPLLIDYEDIVKYHIYYAIMKEDVSISDIEASFAESTFVDSPLFLEDPLGAFKNSIKKSNISELPTKTKKFHRNKENSLQILGRYTDGKLGLVNSTSGLISGKAIDIDKTTWDKFNVGDILEAEIVRFDEAGSIIGYKTFRSKVTKKLYTGSSSYLEFANVTTTEVASLVNSNDNVR